jgi:hypothetical protein
VKIVPLTLRQANELVTTLHRHHKATVGHRFSIGVENDDGELIGAAIVGRPVARNTDQYRKAEIVRLVTDGSRNACSFLLGASRRIAKEMGFDELFTFTLPEEGGTSLKSAGYTFDKVSGGGKWTRNNRTRQDDHPTGEKWRWVAWS